MPTPPPDPLLSTILSHISTLSNEELSGFVGPLLIDFGFSDPTRHLRASSIGASIRLFILTNPLTTSLIQYHRDTLFIHDPYLQLALLTRHAFVHHIQSFAASSHPPKREGFTPTNPELTEPVSG